MVSVFFLRKLRHPEFVDFLVDNLTDKSIKVIRAECRLFDLTNLTASQRRRGFEKVLRSVASQKNLRTVRDVLKREKERIGLALATVFKQKLLKR